jgi:TonB family protein
MAETLKLVPSEGEADALLNYPPERLYVRWAAPASLAFHVLLASIVLILAYLHHITSLRDLMTASITQLPVDQIQILLIDENKPPPPTDHPLWIKQLIIPKVKPPPPPPPPPKPKPKPKPQMVRIVPKLIVGGRSLPAPSYPMEAYEAHIQGTVMIQVVFDGSGGVERAEVVESSGSPVLDSSARHDILSNWHDPDFAGQTQTVPIQFVIPH